MFFFRIILASQSDPSEVREVLNKYLELFEQKSIDFKYHLAPNSVIDWYGRTIRGANKIHDYLRQGKTDAVFYGTEFVFDGDPLEDPEGYEAASV